MLSSTGGSLRFLGLRLAQNGECPRLLSQIFRYGDVDESLFSLPVSCHLLSACGGGGGGSSNESLSLKPKTKHLMLF